MCRRGAPAPPPPLPSPPRPREKMLYSSSRESLKRSLGAGHFAAGDYYCNCEGDVEWAAFQRWSTSEEGAPLSELEVLKREEAAMEKDTSVKSNAMGAIAFQMIPGAREALNELAASDLKEDRVLAITLQDEKVKKRRCLVTNYDKLMLALKSHFAPPSSLYLTALPPRIMPRWECVRAPRPRRWRR